MTQAAKTRPSFEDSISRVGQRRQPFADLYAFLLTARWTTVIGLALAVFLCVNLFFAALYWSVPGSVANADGGFADAFFFSVQTFAAIGYGFMYSEGVFGNTVVVVEAFASLLCIALLTGIVFAKFSRPHARVVFSEPIVIERRDGVRTLTFRLANERGNDVVEASIRVAALMTKETSEGRRIRRFYDLGLERDRTPLFRLSWQVFHPIDEESPLYGLTHQDMCADDVRVIVSMTGMDGTFSQTIHARHIYWAEDVLEGHHFEDVIENLEGGRIRMDYRKFHLTRPEDEA